MDGKELLERYDRLDKYAQSNWEELWQECLDWTLPTSDNLLRVNAAGSEKPVQRLIDVGIEANYNFAAGFFAYNFPIGKSWAKIRHPNAKLMAIESVADYFERVTKVIHDVLSTSNFAQEEFQSLLALGSIGTSCLSVEESSKSVVKFRNHMISEIRIDVDYEGNVDTVARKYKLNGRKAIQQFGEDALRKADLEEALECDAQGKDTEFEFIHMVCPRKDRDENIKNAKNKPFASVYVSKKNGQIVKESGFDYNPFKVARFVVGNNEIYGRSPASMKLSTLRRTNVIYRSMIVSAEQRANPQWLVPNDGSVKGLSQRAGAVIEYASHNPNGRPERLPANGDPQIAMEILRMHEEEVKKMFFNHLFRPLEDYRNMTAYEAQERVTMDQMMLVAFNSRYMDEKITPLIESVYRICSKKRGLLPPVPAELQNDPEFEIEYIGKLSLASKNYEVMGAMNTIRMFAEFGGAFPQFAQPLDNVDPDKLFLESWYAGSSSMNALKEPAERDQERAAKAQAAQQQMMADNIPKVADAAQKLSGAVEPNSIMAQMAGGAQ